MGRSDAELLEASRRGEREAFGALIERYQGVVCAVSYSRTGDRALSEDVAQDTFLAAWRQLDQLREAGRLRAWLCGIARNLARKARLRVEREAPTEALSTTCGGANPFDQVAEVEAERVVRDALTRVPETYRDVLVLYYREHRSVGEVARMLDLSEAATLQRLAACNPEAAESHVAIAEAALAAQLWGEARRHLTMAEAAAPPAGPSRRLCLLLARLEESENGDIAAARTWLDRAVAAPPDPCYVCGHCGGEGADWRSVCPHCGGFDALRWGSRPRRPAADGPVSRAAAPLMLSAADHPTPPSRLA